MLRAIRIFTICAFAIGLLAGFYFLPSDQVSSEPGDSPLYAASLNNTSNHLVGKDNQGRSGDSKGGGMGNLQTCEVTCGPTCSQTTCGLTCVATCEATCANTCDPAATCGVTCVATCEATCANTCAQPTCESTCVVTCDYTCITPITLTSFTAEAGVDQVAVRWSTASEADMYRFVVWRSTNSEGDFTAIQEILGEGSGASNTSYSFVDDQVVAGNTYYYQLSDVSIYGYETLHPMTISATPVAAMGMTDEFNLSQNYPNPFNSETTIRFTIPNTGSAELAVFNMNGRKVWTKIVDAASNNITWNATDNAGNVVPSGVYIYRLTVGDMTASGKMIFMK